MRILPVPSICQPSLSVSLIKYSFPSVFLMFFSAKTQKNDHRPDVAYYAVKQLIYFRYNIFINVLPVFLEMVCNKFCIFFQSDRL